jgi:hypothetical protein
MLVVQAGQVRARTDGYGETERKHGIDGAAVVSPSL